MAEDSKIEWTDHTFNPWIGCQKVGPGCDNCYAETWDNRFEGGRWGPHAERRRTKEQNWNKVRGWNRKARDTGIREKVFVASLADVCDTHRSIPEAWRLDLGRLVEECEALDFLFLTKRAGNIEPALRMTFPQAIPSNLWMGLTVVDQHEADRDVLRLGMAKINLGIAVTFLSIEPMLGAIDLTALRCKDGEGTDLTYNALSGEAWVEGSASAAAYSNAADGVPVVDWVICGGESGPDARPMHPDWARGLRDQCAAAGTGFLFKQWGEWAPGDAFEMTHDQPVTHKNGDVKDWMDRYVMTETWGARLRGHSWTGHSTDLVYRVGKKPAGRLLDGRTWDGGPGHR